MSPETHEVEIFISYSSHDKVLVEKLSAILRVVNPKIFRDADNIAPGQKWELKILDSLAAAKTVIVFWCRHSKSSEWVEKEINESIEGNKKIVPVLLDDTPMPKHLCSYQAIPFKDFSKHERLLGLLVRWAGVVLARIGKLAGGLMGIAAVLTALGVVLSWLPRFSIMLGPNDPTEYEPVSVSQGLWEILILCLYIGKYAMIAGVIALLIVVTIAPVWRSLRGAFQSRQLKVKLQKHILSTHSEVG